MGETQLASHFLLLRSIRENLEMVLLKQARSRVVRFLSNIEKGNKEEGMGRESRDEEKGQRRWNVIL